MLPSAMNAHRVNSTLQQDERFMMYSSCMQDLLCQIHALLTGCAGS